MEGSSVFQEANKGRSRWLCRWASTSSSGSDRSASSLQAAADGLVTQRRQLERQCRNVARVEGEQSLRGRRRTGHRGVDDASARSPRASGRRPHPPRLPRPRGAVWRRAGPSPRPARLGAPAVAGRAPVRATPDARRAPVCGRRFRDRPCATDRLPVCTAAATDAVTRPVVRIRRRRNAPQRRRGRGPGLRLTASSTPPECTCPPVGRRESDSVSRVARLVIDPQKRK